MDRAPPVIKKVSALSYKIIVVEASDGIRYEADLTSLAKVYCFPRNISEWKRLSIDNYGLGVIWSSRFEVHVDQIIGLATKVEKIKTAG